MSPTAAFAVLWVAKDGRPTMLDVDGDGPEAFVASERIAIDLAETGRRDVRLVVTDLERIPTDEWEEAKSRLVKARVLVEVRKVLESMPG